MSLEVINNIPFEPIRPKRVAAYVRVSSDKDAAMHSLNNQIVYYQQMITDHKDWQLVEIFVDKGLSGTKGRNRKELQRLLHCCRAGQIDLVITKSVTRLARNTVLLLKIVRELKNYGIDIYFEKEQIHTLSKEGEIMLTMLATMAEAEAASASENQLWRIKKRYEAGKPWVCNALGYRLVDGEIVVEPKEAKLVKWIFKQYLAGDGTCKIANQINESEYRHKDGRKWTSSAIVKILHNDIYVGDLTLQKTYRENHRTKNSKTNVGQRRKYLIRDNHEPLVSREDFAKVQEIARVKALKYRKERA